MLFCVGIVANAFPAVDIPAVIEGQRSNSPDISLPVVVNADQVDSAPSVVKSKVPVSPRQVATPLFVVASPEATAPQDTVKLVPEKQSVDLIRVARELHDAKIVGLGRYKGKGR